MLLFSFRPNFNNVISPIYSNNYISNCKNIPEIAINTVNIDYLGSTSITLLLSGVKNLLIEKPGDLNLSVLKKIEKLSCKNNAVVSIAYNRRFYSSTLHLIDLINILCIHLDRILVFQSLLREQ